eukprot:CAMPEP_0201591552 /NCGR_PEP_ID=MMETSP0190_2-20130828/189698_1 /ASSEMBLY_ACC=CAM_ASM_000263 /TAXON_ID=37353 /ORGANISM="Rosalina sp." /LENGTH=760 /DNA_ID=CAMNT_0048049943 /DNA_START=677 /DNA_END=2956 /DNA_ORIENTATION=+
MMFNYFLLGFIAIFFNPSAGKEQQTYTYLSAKVMEEEIGIDWWDILNADASCCTNHGDQDDCENEGGEEEIGIDWWDILNADATCCPGNLDESDCNAEAGSNCVWFPKPNNEIAVAAGSQCVGASYVKCKRKGGIDACCTPACNGNAPKIPGGPDNAGPESSPPICGPETPSPVTPSPTKPACELGVNYQFEGGSCKISGDPHTTMFNGNRHDFQGTPTYSDAMGLRNQFYYIHPCSGESSADMPIKVAGTHYHWGSRDVSGVDYLSITLTDLNGDIYQVYLSSGIAGYTGPNSGASSNYDTANGNGLVTSLTSGTSTSIGTRFSIHYTQISHNHKASFKITIDGDKEFPIYMQGQTSYEGGRYKMHYVQMSVPQELKCFTCGLCGDFNIKTTGATTEAMETCDGNLIDYRAGWYVSYTPEAYDTYGWTWEKLFADNQCGLIDYDNKDNKKVPVVDACDPAIETDVINACDAAIAAQQDCCDTIGNGFCEGLNSDCKVDACAGANGDKTKIDEQIQAIIIDPIEAVCNNDDLIDENPLPDPLEFSCVKRTGPSVKTPGVDSSVTCQPGEVLTSCGVAGTHLLDGTYIDPASPNTCNAKTLSSSWDMKAVAVCCSFTGVTATVSTSTSTTMNGELQVVTTCPAGSSVTGCQVDIITGGMSRSGGDLRGSYAGSNAGKNTAPTSNGEADGVSTNNQCVAESQSSSTTIRGGAQCLSLSDGYEFDCVATSQYTSKSGFNGNCPTDYKLVGCMTYTPSNTLDAW